MWWLSRRYLARHIDVERVRRAVAEQEGRTSGEIVVSIAPFFWGSVRAAAERAFHRLRVDRTPDRNGVLLFFVPGRRAFYLRGDEVIHARLGQAFWDQTAAALELELRAGDLTGAIVEGVRRIGDALAAQFPAQGPRANRLPDEPEIR